MTSKYTAETFHNKDTHSTWITVKKDGWFHESKPASEHIYGKIKSVEIDEDETMTIVGEDGYEITKSNGRTIERDGVKLKR